MALSATLPIQDSAASLFQASSSDVDEHCAALGRWRLSYDQISAGAFRGSFTQLSLPRVEVFREITSQQVRQYGQLGADSFGIGLPWDGDGELSCNGTSAGGAHVLASIDAEIDMCTPKAFELRGVVASTMLIAELAARLDIESPRSVWHQLRVIEMAEVPVARLRAHLAAIHETITAAPGSSTIPRHGRRWRIPSSSTSWTCCRRRGRAIPAAAPRHAGAPSTAPAS